MPRATDRYADGETQTCTETRPRDKNRYKWRNRQRQLTGNYLNKVKETLVKDVRT